MSTARAFQTRDAEARTVNVSARFGSGVTRLFVLVLYALLSIGMTYPLVLELRTAIPGPPWDNLVWLYDLAWFRHSIVDLAEWPMFNPTIFWPSGYDLRLSETMLANKALIAPVLFWGDEILAYNVLLLMTFVLTGYTTYLLVAYLTDNQFAAVVSGAIFTFSPYRMHAMAAGWLPLLSTQWIPLVFLYMERSLRERRLGHSLWMGFFMGLTLLSSWYYIYVVGSMVVIYLAIRLRPWKENLRRDNLGRNLFLGALVVAAMTAPVAFPVIMGRSGEMGWELAEVEKWAASLDDAFLPNVYHPVWGKQFLISRAYTLRYPWYAPGFIYLGYGAMFLALIGLTGKKRSDNVRGALFWMILISLVLAQGIALRWQNELIQIEVPRNIEETFVRGMSTLMSKWAINKASYYDIAVDPGKIPIPLPALLIYLFVPMGSAMRTLYRFGVMSMFGVALLAGIGAAGWLGGGRAPYASRLQGRTDLVDVRYRKATFGKIIGATLLLALVLVDFVSAPLPYGFTDIKAQPLDRWLAAQPDDTVVMQFPLVRACSGDTLYRTLFHEKMVAYGHGTFYPEQFLYSMPVLSTFPSEESLELLDAWGVTHIVVGSQVYDAGWGDQPGQTWEQVHAQISATPRLHFEGVTQDEPIWRDESVSKIIYGSPPVDPILVDKVYVYELR